MAGLASDDTADAEQALERIYDSHVDAVLAFAWLVTGNPSVAEQVVEDVFVQLWDEAGAVESSGRLRSRLITEAHRRCGELLGGYGEELRAASGPTAGVPVAAVDGNDGGAGRRPGPEGLGALPLEQRLAIALAHFGGLTVAEIAVVLGVSRDVVLRRIHHGLHQLADA